MKLLLSSFILVFGAFSAEATTYKCDQNSKSKFLVVFNSTSTNAVLLSALPAKNTKPSDEIQPDEWKVEYSQTRIVPVPDDGPLIIAGTDKTAIDWTLPENKDLCFKKLKDGITLRLDLRTTGITGTYSTYPDLQINPFKELCEVPDYMTSPKQIPLVCKEF